MLGEWGRGFLMAQSAGGRSGRAKAGLAKSAVHEAQACPVVVRDRENAHKYAASATRRAQRAPERLRRAPGSDIFGQAHRARAVCAYVQSHQRGQSPACWQKAQKKGRALSSAEVQQGGMKTGKCRCLHALHLGLWCCPFKGFSSVNGHFRYAFIAWLAADPAAIRFCQALSCFCGAP